MATTTSASRRQIGSAGDLKSVLRTMKAFAAKVIGQSDSSSRKSAWKDFVAISYLFRPVDGSGDEYRDGFQARLKRIFSMPGLGECCSRKNLSSDDMSVTNMRISQSR